ncbi:MAG: site-specific DNA-methyltransferase [Parcubacteria group bacterium]|jgi:adenine-specific DNA-methyltransferase
MNKYEKLSKEELLKLVEKQEEELKSKKYGLVWDSEREPEQVVLDCENNLPVLKRVKGKEIRTCDGEDNILIEGDNYHALTVLNYTHKEKIDVIYIDPPYNTGNKDFIYNDRYVDREDGYRHSKWLNFMEKRLNLAKDLLKETGVIFISIDDNEASQLKLLCDKIFGEENFISKMVIQSNPRGSQSSKHIAEVHEYVLVYAKLERNLFIKGFNKTEENISEYSNVDDSGRKYRLLGLRQRGGEWKREQRPKMFYPIYINPKDNSISLIKTEDYFIETLPKRPTGEEGRWTWSREKLEANINLLIGKKVNRKGLDVFYDIFRKDYLLDEIGNESVSKPKTIWLDKELNYQNGRNEIKNILGEDAFNYPKPTFLIKKIIEMTESKEGIVLDFMAGSGTTGHAVLDLNKEDGGNRKFILCTNNELNGLADELKEKGMSEKEIKEYGICRRVTYPRLERVINGYKNAKDEKVEGLGENLQYFRTDFVKKTKNKDQVRVNLTQKCTEMLCVKENIFNPEIEKEDYKIFSSNKKDKFLCVYYNFLDDSFDEFLKEIKKLKGKKVVYMFSMDGTVDSSLFSNINDFEIEEIPQKILDIYKQLAKMNIPVKSDAIFPDFEKAKNKIFDEEDKDDGARILRIVLEKVIQKISQNNGLNIIKENSKEEKASILNDKLKSENIFSKVQWEENKTYLAIGNHASHGEYSEYDLKNVENFHKHIQKLIDQFNIQ